MDISSLNKQISDREALIQDGAKRLTLEGIPHIGGLLYAFVCKNEGSNFAAACVELKVKPDLWKGLLDNEFFSNVVDTIESTGKFDFWKVSNAQTAGLVNETKTTVSQVIVSRKKPVVVNPAQFISYPVKSDEEIKNLSLYLVSKGVKISKNIIARFGITPYSFGEILRGDKVFATKFHIAYKKGLNKRGDISQDELNEALSGPKKPQSGDNFGPQVISEKSHSKAIKPKKEKISKVKKVKPQKTAIVKKVTEKQVKIPAEFIYKNHKDSNYQLKKEIIKVLIENSLTISKLSNKKGFDRVYVLMNQDKKFADIMNGIIKSRRGK